MDMLYCPVEHPDFEQPIREKCGWAICFSARFYPTPTLRGQSANCGMPPDRKATQETSHQFNQANHRGGMLWNFGIELRSLTIR